jgi:undecaprenyl-diphosphatase
MDVVQAIVLGLIQGLTEFFPISSSGHLALARNIFGISTDNALLLDIMLHAGPLVAVFAGFGKAIWALFKPPF